MYDLREDPEELNNIYLSLEHRELRDELTRKLWTLQASLGDSPHESQPTPKGLDLIG
ncbi:hypothetical protein [Leifsonia sp. A12D58]|uniref:hypothetical protein n=1 Tax=Leifsonia sp. A12D58 TaxID=3397674 RepID=UPI0039DFB71E